MKNLLIIITIVTIHLFFFTNGQAQNTQIQTDPRINIYYTPQQIADLKQNNPGELKKLNHYFQHSFLVEASTVPNASAIDLMSIDAKRFESQRHATKRVEIIISRYDDKLILKSQKELDKEYSFIK